MHDLLIVCLQRVESCRCVPAKELPIAIRRWLTRRNALFFELLPSHSAGPLVFGPRQTTVEFFCRYRGHSFRYCGRKNILRINRQKCGASVFNRQREEIWTGSPLEHSRRRASTLMFGEPVHLAWCARACGAGLLDQPRGEVEQRDSLQLASGFVRVFC
jgi:hypothetical protein